MSLGPTDEQLVGFQRKMRHDSFARARQWVVLHHRGARAEGSTIWWSFWVGDEVVGYAWPVQRSPTDWWAAIKPIKYSRW